ncbi:MAG: hypothetical protein IPL35_16130 [Sphingobacteriales bacterium]|nr:hypothetical protein [Sphingobacteriales bacterium]
MKQVRAGYEFCKYICQTAKRLHNYPQNIDIQYRGLVLSKKTYSGGSKPDNFYQTDPLATELQHQHLPEKQSINLEILAY